jgi:hypothetical protein
MSFIQVMNWIERKGISRVIEPGNSFVSPESQLYIRFLVH